VDCSAIEEKEEQVVVSTDVDRFQAFCSNSQKPKCNVTLNLFLETNILKRSSNTTAIDTTYWLHEILSTLNFVSMSYVSGNIGDFSQMIIFYFVFEDL
jgi:hypothetical protein